MTPTHQRNYVVTLVKAIGIILMVLGHVLTSGVVRNAIFTFHMPLFFLMSGYCFKEKYFDDAKQFVVQKIKGIYVPFVLFSLPFLAMHNVFCHWNIYDPEWIYGWKDFAWQTSRIVTRMSHNEALLGTFWFLKELFWGNIIFYAAYKLSKGKILPTVISLFLLTEFACMFHLRIPYFSVAHTSTYAAFFIACGYLWKKYDWKTDKWWIMVIGVVSVIMEAFLCKGIAIDMQTPISLVYYVLPAITGTMVIFEVCRYVDIWLRGAAKSVMLFIGEHTLSIMALHFFAFKIVTLGYIRANQLPTYRLEDFPVMCDYAGTISGFILYLIIGLFIPLICAWIWLEIKEKMTGLVQNSRSRNKLQ